MNETYEIRLREEFLNLRALQNQNEVKSILEIKFMDRLGKDLTSIQNDPKSGAYPNHYQVIFKMPVYVDEGQLNNDWQGIFTFKVPQEILMNPNSKNPEYKFSTKGGKPFNNHVESGWICLGNAWEVSQQGFGLWYFIIAVGCIINQEKGWTDDADKHLDSEAYKFWKHTRKMQPINDIKWPLNLRDKKFSFGDNQKTNPSKTKGKFKIGKGSITLSSPTKKAFTIKKNKSEVSKKSTSKFKIGKPDEN